jgi:hypothetical protein
MQSERARAEVRRARLRVRRVTILTDARRAGF